MKALCKATLLLVGVAVMSQNASVQASEPFNHIDGFTCASLYPHLHVAESAVFRTYAVIIWKEFFTSFKVDSYKLLWGTQKGVYTDSLDLFSHLAPPSDDSWGIQPFTHDTLKNLKENTAYFAEFNMNFNRKVFKQEFRFNTPPLPTIHPIDGTRILNKQPALHVVRNSNTVVELYTLRGEKIGNIPLSYREKLETELHHEMPAGLYMVVKRDMKSSLIYQKMTIRTW